MFYLTPTIFMLNCPFLLKFIYVGPFKPPYLTGFNRDQLYKNIPLVLHQMIGVGRDKSNK